jgi:hypothetical protein
VATARRSRPEVTWSASTASLLDWTVVRPRGTTVLHWPRLVAVDVYRELERAAERLGLPMIPASVALWQ